jgi:dTDP-4-amino-4,6-dideoxygalactose transaminase
VIDEGYLVGGGRVEEFERNFARYVGGAECIGVGNGLDALRIGLEALGIGPGDEVIVPGFTFFATWLAVLQVGATPVAVDVDPSDASINSDEVAAAITSRTRAVIVVHLYGIPGDLARLRKLADESAIALIEDAAQSHGAYSGGVRTGSVGDIAAFSFYPTKNLGALGDGGAIVTSSAQLAVTARRRRSYGQGISKYDHIDTGWNSRLDTLQAAFLADSLRGLDVGNERRRVIAAEYLVALGARSASVVGVAKQESSVWHHFVLRTTDREAVRAHFEERGIGTDIHYPYYFNTAAPLEKFRGEGLPNARALAAGVLSFPIAPWLDDSEVAQVAGAMSSLPDELVAND